MKEVSYNEWSLLDRIIMKVKVAWTIFKGQSYIVVTDTHSSMHICTQDAQEMIDEFDGLTDKLREVYRLETIRKMRGRDESN